MWRVQSIKLDAANYALSGIAVFAPIEFGGWEATFKCGTVLKSKTLSELFRESIDYAIANNIVRENSEENIK